MYQDTRVSEILKLKSGFGFEAFVSGVEDLLLGPDELSMFWSHASSKAIVSDTSTTLQPDVGSVFGLYTKAVRL